MGRKISQTLALLLCLAVLPAGAQVQGFAYQRSLTQVKPGWMRVELPDSLFDRLNAQNSDLRVYALSDQQDTIEVPWLWQQRDDKRVWEEQPFRLLNQVSDQRYSYYTLEMENAVAIGQIDLEFRQENFDWRIVLEASNDQRAWFVVGDNFRVVGIRNSWADYRYVSLHFAPLKYRYFRVKVNHPRVGLLSEASVLAPKGQKGEIRQYPTTWQQTDDKANKQTVLRVQLPSRVPVARVDLRVADTVDYLRPLRIEYLSDTTHTAKGVVEHWAELYSGTLSSYEGASYGVETRYASALRVTLHNADNVPLRVDSVLVQGPTVGLLVRFPEAQRYWLDYGQAQVQLPDYDLGHFVDKVPDIVPAALLGAEEKSQTAGFDIGFGDKQWLLWLAIGAIALLLGFFALRMLRQETGAQPPQA